MTRRERTMEGIMRSQAEFRERDHAAEVSDLRASVERLTRERGFASKECERLAERAGECHRDMTLAQSRLAAAEAERDRDLADMRRFQAEFIAADHARLAAEADADRLAKALGKIRDVTDAAESSADRANLTGQSVVLLGVILGVNDISRAALRAGGDDSPPG